MFVATLVLLALALVPLRPCGARSTTRPGATGLTVDSTPSEPRRAMCDTAGTGDAPRSHEAVTGLPCAYSTGDPRDLERRPELPLHERDRGRARRARSRRLVEAREGLADKLAAETTPLDAQRALVGLEVPDGGLPGLLHAAGYARDLHAVYVVCDGTCAKTFLR